MYATVSEVDSANRRARLKITGYNTSVWTIYDPSSLSLEEGNVVAVAAVRGSLPNVTIISKVAQGTSTKTTVIVDV